jgi:sulfatase maturation enzyme AslB (radical SAM superfamily)
MLDFIYKFFNLIRINFSNKFELLTNNEQIATFTYDNFIVAAPVGTEKGILERYVKSGIPQLIDSKISCMAVNPKEMAKTGKFEKKHITGGLVLPPAVIFNVKQVPRNRLDEYIQMNSDTISSLPAVKFSDHEIYEMVYTFSKYVMQGNILATDHCNLKCFMCQFHGSGTEYGFEYADTRVKQKRYILDFELALKHLEALPKNIYMLFSGAGEFLTYQHWKALFKHAAYIGLKPSLITNAMLMDEKTTHFLLDNNLSSLIVSCDGYDKKSYERIRRGGNFETVVKNVDYLFQQKNKIANTYIPVHINNILFEETKPYKEQIVDMWKGKADTLNFIVERLNHFSVPRETYFETLQDLKYCYEPLYGIFLMADGRYAPCCAITIADWFEKFDWLLDSRETTYAYATHEYRKMMLHPDSPLQKFCSKCHYKLASYIQNGISPFAQTIILKDFN